MKMRCKRCGREGNILCPVGEDKVVVLCAECYQLLGHCPACKERYCGFFNGPDPMPQFVMIERQHRQGNATFVEQRQVPNPARVKKFCVDEGCKCYNGDEEHPLCCRHGGYTTCTNYNEVELENFV